MNFVFPEFFRRSVFLGDITAIILTSTIYIPASSCRHVTDFRFFSVIYGRSYFFRVYEAGFGFALGPFTSSMYACSWMCRLTCVTASNASRALHTVVSRSSGKLAECGSA